MGLRVSNVLVAVVVAAASSLASSASTEPSPSPSAAAASEGCPSVAGRRPAGAPRARRFTTYLNAADATRGLQDLSHDPAVAVVSGQWLRFTTTGALVPLPRAPSRADAGRIVRQLHARGIKVFVTITNKNEQGDWDPELTRTMLADREHAARQFARYARAVGYDGIDLDIERLGPQDMQGYVDFLRRLSRKLHRDHKQLTVYLKARTLTDDGGRHGANIARHVDQIRLGTYNYHLSTNKDPEPFAPYGAVERDLCQVLAYVPPAKLALGLTSKGIDWPVDEQGRKANTNPPRSRQWLDLRRELPDGTTFRWDTDARGTEFLISSGSLRRHGWLEDGRSARHKLLLADRYGVDAFLFRLGGSDPLIWTYVNQWVAGTLR